MNDYFVTAKLFDNDTLIESDKEDINNTYCLLDEDLLLESEQESVTNEIGEIEKHFGNLGVVKKTLDSAEPSTNAHLVLKSTTVPYNTSSVTPAGKKRQRDPDNSLDSPTTEIPRKQRKVFMAPPENEPEAKPDLHLVLLLPDLEEANLFSTKHAEKIEESVHKAIKAETNPDIKFEYAYTDRGRFKFVCPNLTAKNCAMGIVPKLTGLWADAKIKAMDLGVIPRMVKAPITFNNKPPNPVDLFEGIDNKNEGIDTIHWRVYQRKKVQGGKTVFFIGIDEDSVGALREIGFRPYFEVGRIKITVQENNNNN